MSRHGISTAISGVERTEKLASLSIMVALLRLPLAPIEHHGCMGPRGSRGPSINPPLYQEEAVSSVAGVRANELCFVSRIGNDSVMFPHTFLPKVSPGSLQLFITSDLLFFYAAFYFSIEPFDL